jgi:hypothetical protein
VKPDDCQAKIWLLTKKTDIVWIPTAFWPAPAHEAEEQLILQPVRSQFPGGQFGRQDLAGRDFGQGTVTVTQQPNTPLFSSTCK